MADISYFEAWGMWLAGRSTLGHHLMGVPMVWWGRAGKTVAFVGGLTIILDIAGQKRMRTFGRSIAHMVLGAGIFAAIISLMLLPVIGAVFWPDDWDSWGIDVPVVGFVVDFVTDVFLLALLGGALLAGIKAISFLAGKAYEGLLVSFDHPRHVHMRVAAGLLVLIGFHFDLLAS